MSSLPQQLPAGDAARDTKSIGIPFNDVKEKSMQAETVDFLQTRNCALCISLSLQFRIELESRAKTELLRRIGWKGSPYNQVSSYQSDGCVPSKDRVGKVKGGNDSNDSQGVPLLHHEVAGPLGGEDAPVQHAAEADRVVADVDKLLQKRWQDCLARELHDRSLKTTELDVRIGVESKLR